MKTYCSTCATYLQVVLEHLIRDKQDNIDISVDFRKLYVQDI